MGRYKIVAAPMLHRGESVKVSKYESVIKKLRKRLKGKVVIVGVGNPLKGDDGAGPFFIQQLKVGTDTTFRCKSSVCPYFLDAGEVPENYIGPIIKAKPDTIMVVDAADFGGKPGEMKIFEAGNLIKTGFTTHTLSPSVFMNYLKQETRADVFLLAIQPKTVELGAPLTSELKSSITKLVEKIKGTGSFILDSHLFE